MRRHRRCRAGHVQGGGRALMFPHHEMSTSHARLLDTTVRTARRIEERWAYDRRSLPRRHYSKGAHRMKTPEPVRTLDEDFLARAAEDWVSAAELIDLVKSSRLTDPSMLRDLAMGLVGRLICQGLVVAGYVTSDGFHPWPLSTGESITKIVREWSSESDPFVMPGAISWFDTTDQGQAAGESVLLREGGRA